MNAVSIRSYGIVSTYGLGVAPLVDGLRAERNSSAPLSSAPVDALRHLNANVLPAGLFTFDERGVLAAIRAAIDEALRGAGVRTPLEDCALIFGANALALSEHDYLRLYRESPDPDWRVHDPGSLASPIARDLGVRGPVFTFSTACSSSANALLLARDLIVRGEVSLALVVGFELVSMITASGFQSLMMLDPQGCRPFDVSRGGLQLGEGIAALLLEAQGPGARLLGGANLCDIHHVTSASPDGSGMARCMNAALADAAVAARDILAVKVHGTASHENDSAEAAAMRTVFGDRLPPFTGLKGYVGHTLSACGAVESVAMLAAIDAGFIPATLGFSMSDPELGCAPVATSMPARAGNYLFNYFGFGGNYASLVVEHG